MPDDSEPPNVLTDRNGDLQRRSMLGVIIGLYSSVPSILKIIVFDTVLRSMPLGVMLTPSAWAFNTIALAFLAAQLCVSLIVTPRWAPRLSNRLSRRGWTAAWVARETFFTLFGIGEVPCLLLLAVWFVVQGTRLQLLVYPLVLWAIGCAAVVPYARDAWRAAPAGPVRSRHPR